MIPPGSWLGVLGGGQLGRMFTQAAHRMGYRVVVFDPDPKGVAAAVADQHLCASFEDVNALDELARRCMAVTVETENIPAAALERLASRIVTSPNAHSLSIAQDRIREKAFITRIGLTPAPYLPITDRAALSNADLSPFLPGLLKLSRMGYDGKGQIRVNTASDVANAFETFGGAPCVLERRIQLKLELSVLLARSSDGTTAVWPVFENQHKNGILDITIAPARISPALALAAHQAAARLAEALEYCGVLCVEFFVDERGTLLVNEFAPRPHNSGHATLDAACTSQFEQQVRTLARLPLGDTRLLTPAVMQNLMGELWRGSAPDWRPLLAESAATLHLYGKADARDGRKMGHYTCVGSTIEEALRKASHLYQQIKPAACAETTNTRESCV